MNTGHRNNPAQMLRNLEFLSNSAARLLDMRTSQEVFDFTAEQVRCLVDEALVIVNEYDAGQNATILRALLSGPDEIDALTGMLGASPVGLTLPFAEDTRGQMHQGALVQVEGGMYELCFGQVPLVLCQAIEQQLGLGDIYAIPFTLAQDFLGTIAILTHRRGPIKNARIIEAFVGQAAIALKRLRADAEQARLIQQLEDEHTRIIKDEETQGRLVAILEATPDIVLTCTADGHVLYLNQAARQVFGVPDGVDLTQFSIFSGHPPQYAKKLEEESLPIAAQEGIWQGETVIWGREQQEIPVSQVIIAHKTLDGQVVYYSTITRDMRERQESEAALRKAHDELENRVQERTQELMEANQHLQYLFQELSVAEKELRLQNEEIAATNQSLQKARKQAIESRQRYKGLFEFAPDGYLETDDEGKIREVNQAASWLLNMPRKKLIGQKLKDFIYPKDLEHFESGLESLQVSKSPSSGPQSGRDGSVQWETRFQPFKRPPFCSAVTVSYIHGSHGQPATMLWMVHDISQRKEFEYTLRESEEKLRKLNQELQKALDEEHTMRKQLIQAEKHSALSRMVASVAHEINNPIQTIQNCMFILDQEIPADSKLREFMEMSFSETRRIAKLVEQLRATYRPTESKPAELLDLLALIRDVHALLAPHLQYEKVNWELFPPREPVYVKGSADQLKQVFINICMNAIEAMQPQGGELEVHIMATEPSGRVGIAFIDDGPGIVPENMDKLFEPFFTTKENGTGLGLPICYDLVQAHGGEIRVKSQLGHGAAFVVWLPCAEKK